MTTVRYMKNKFGGNFGRNDIFQFSFLKISVKNRK